MPPVLTALFLPLLASLLAQNYIPAYLDDGSVVVALPSSLHVIVTADQWGAHSSMSMSLPGSAIAHYVHTSEDGTLPHPCALATWFGAQWYKYDIVCDEGRVGRSVNVL